MKLTIKKSVVAFLLMLLLAGGFVFPPRAQAIFGLADITVNPEGVVGWIWNVAEVALNTFLESTLEALKKRLLDQITDQIVNWIQNGQEPRFLSDFSGFIADTAQVTAGDVARDVGLGDLCTGISPTRIKIQLEQPYFSERVSCTLDQIVGNVERFGQSFANGGWIGYQELLKPQNNRYGVELLVQGELEKRAGLTGEANKLEVQTGQGFKSTKECLEWTLYFNVNGKTEVRGQLHQNDEGFSPDPSKPPAVAEGGEATNQQWKCTEDRATTPGTVIAKGLEKALYSNIDFLVNSSGANISTYLGAILDAAINRVIKEGVKGVQNIALSNESSEPDCSDPNLSAAVRRACLEHQSKASERDELTKSTQGQQKATQTSADLIVLRAAIINASTSNAVLVSAMEALASCESGRSLTCTRSPDLPAVKNNSTVLNNYLLEAQKIDKEVDDLQNALRNAVGVTASAITSRVNEELDIRIQRVKELLTLVQTKSGEISNALTAVQNSLTACKDASQTYTCPAPPTP